MSTKQDMSFDFRCDVSIAFRVIVWVVFVTAMPRIALSLSPAVFDGVDPQLADVLPDRPGVYVWCDDAKGTFGRLFDYVATSVQRDLADDVERLERNADESEFGRRVADVARAVRLLREGVFDSQAVWMYASDDGSEFHHSFIAHSQASDEDITSLMTGLHSMASIRAGDTENNSDKPPSEFGRWTYEDGWLIWSENDAAVDDLRQCIQNGSEHSLAQNRSFQMVFASQRRNRRDWPKISLFVSNEIIPKLLVSGNPCKELMDVSGWDKWQQICDAAFVNEFRGFGGEIYLPNEDMARRMDSILACDLSLLVSAPRSGVFAAIEHNQGITFDVPLIDKPLAQFIQFEVNGQSLARGIQETNDRMQDFANLGYAFGRAKTSDYFLNLHSLDRIDGQSSLELLKETSRALSVEYFESPSAAEGRPESLDVWNAIEIGRADGTLDAVTQTLNDGQDGLWQREKHGDISTWSVSPEFKSKLADNLDEQIRQRGASEKLQLANSEGTIRIQFSIVGNGNPGTPGNNIKPGAIMLKLSDLVVDMSQAYKDKLARYLSEAYASVGDWLFIRPIRAKDLDHIPEATRDVGLWQMEDLKSTVDKINAEFDSTACGVFAQWPKRFLRNFRSLLQNYRSAQATDSKTDLGEGQTASDADREPDDSELDSLLQRLRECAETTAASVGKMVLVVENGQSGFRIVGGVMKKSVKESAPESN